jgi:hypothetical protein
MSLVSPAGTTQLDGSGFCQHGVGLELGASVGDTDGDTLGPTVGVLDGD